MTPQAQRVAIAKVMGWTRLHDTGMPSVLMPGESVSVGALEGCPPGRDGKPVPSIDYASIPNGTVFFHEGNIRKRVPDYLNDLNAMHEAEEVLTLRQRVIYGAMLAERFNDSPLGESFDAIESAKDESCRWSSYSVYLAATATAAQRAEAFLRTLNLWDDSNG